MTIDDALRARIEAWSAADPDPETRDELAHLVADADAGTDPGAAGELRDRFAGRVGFGTAGVRAPLGAGPRRMNRLVVRQLAAGLVRWLARRHPDRPVTVVVGYDARRLSDAFARDVAGVVAALGGRALLLPAARPTPVLAFAVRHFGATAGVMCTASHNPPADNGAKVYLGDGAQIAAPDDAELAALVAELAGAEPAVPVAPPDDPAVTLLDDKVVRAYADHVAGLGLATPDGVARDLWIVYTPLHGVGGFLVTDLLRRSGFRMVDVVYAQRRPDGRFPTTPYPDPEEPGALDLALDQARRCGADLVLANDPDADRLGVAVPDPDGDGDWRILSGNEIGVLLCEAVLRRGKGADRLVVSSITSTRMLAAIAGDHGVHHLEVPSGFKWIVRAALARPEWRFVFGFEEALGFSVDPQVRDKDGVSAAVAMAGLVAELRMEGRTVLGELERLGRRHGLHASRTWSLRQAELAGRSPEDVVARWRRQPPTELAGRPVASVDDLMAGGGGWSPTDAIVVMCGDGTRVVVRPSGTEPKVKIHLEVVEPVASGPEGFGAALRVADGAVEELRQAVGSELL